jgi:SpoVK/Ycf46/Vps4 family AAA+-type ATPase
LGLLSQGKLISKNASDFIGTRPGHSLFYTKKILSEAKGNVLLIDEAYMLNAKHNSNCPFRREVTDTIVGKVQNAPGEDICIIMCGYKQEMEDYIRDANPGLQRRFPIDEAFNFEEFNEEQLDQILHLKMQKQGVKTDDQGRAAAMAVLKLAKQRPNFGNGGAVDNVLAQAVANYGKRFIKMPLEMRRNQSEVLLSDVDFDPDFKRALHAEIEVDRLFEDLIGLEPEVDEFRRYSRIVKNMSILKKDPKRIIPFSFVFEGPPGCGKTTVARKIGKLYRQMGLLATDEVVEVSAQNMIAEYLGQTPTKTRAVLKRALGKVLVIDEAYRLAGQQSSHGYAAEARDELVDAMTKPQFEGKLVIILAGYSSSMAIMLTQNPGLASRFPNHIRFQSLSPKACTQLLKKRIGEYGVAATFNEKEPNLYILFKRLGATNNWGNGRDVESIAKEAVGQAFEKIKGDDNPVADHDLVLGILEKWCIQQAGSLPGNGRDVESIAKEAVGQAFEKIKGDDNPVADHDLVLGILEKWCIQQAGSLPGNVEGERHGFPKLDDLSEMIPEDYRLLESSLRATNKMLEERLKNSSAPETIFEVVLTNAKLAGETLIEWLVRQRGSLPQALPTYPSIDIRLAAGTFKLMYVLGGGSLSENEPSEIHKLDCLCDKEPEHPINPDITNDVMYTDAGKLNPSSTHGASSTRDGLYSTPLIQNRQETRLVSIVRGSGPQIICSLRTISLENGPRYFALSYRWGDPKDTTDILVNGRPVPVTRNLEAAMRRLRDFQNGFYCFGIWIDALCINQSDLEEKAYQVPMMGQIYSRAERVIAWLGASDAANAGLKMNRMLAHGKTEGIRRMLCTADPPIGFLNPDPYWDRSWILQELCLPKEPPIVLSSCSYMCLDHCFEAMWMQVNIFFEETSVPPDLEPDLDIQSIKKLYSLDMSIVNSMMNLFCVRSLRARLHARNVDGNVLLQLLLEAGIRREATNQADRVYALLGLMQERHRRLIPVVYDTHYMEAFKSFFRMLWRTDVAHVLGTINFPPRDHFNDHPSWAPNLSKLNLTVQTKHALRFDAHWRGGHAVELSENENQILVEGLSLGRIVVLEKRASEVAWDQVDNAAIKPPAFEFCHLVQRSLQAVLRASISARASLRYDAGIPGLATSFDIDHVYLWHVLRHPLEDYKMTHTEYDPDSPQFLKFWTKFILQDDPSSSYEEYIDHNEKEDNIWIERTLEHINNSVKTSLHGQAFACTGFGLVVICPNHCEEGDELVLLHGFNTPMVLRHVPDGHYVLVGAARPMSGGVTELDLRKWRLDKLVKSTYTIG